MCIRCHAGDADFKKVIPTHIKELTDVMIILPRDKTEFQIIVVDGYGIRVELVVLLSFELELCTDLEVFECFASIPVAESGNVEIHQVYFLHFSFHNRNY